MLKYHSKPSDGPFSIVVFPPPLLGLLMNDRNLNMAIMSAQPDRERNVLYGEAKWKQDQTCKWMGIRQECVRGVP